ncbi:hypothetical protein [Pseudomonas palleroniana]|uniref:hypothetical protein n=1 Tax=Pseudomonas palleroniana TaxID=191390 RepID=UPI0018E6CBCB|nr:hypothetical protein [Pseudomonas palleroniana]MBI6911063.1 hypothetical protein [Pseudomonas palleroniana]
MKEPKIFAALLSTFCLSLHASESQDDFLFQANRCALAYGLGIHSDPSVITKSAVVTGKYMRDQGIQKNYAEISAINDKAMQEIMGAPDSPVKEWEARAQKITESEFCEKYLSILQSD